MIIEFTQRSFFLGMTLMVILIFLGIYFDIQPKWICLRQAYTDEKSLQARIVSEKIWISQENKILFQWQALKNEMSPILQIDNRTLIEEELLTAIVHAGELNGLVITSIQPINWQTLSGVNALIMHVVALGSYAQFVGFDAMLAQYSLPIMLEDFSIHGDQNGELQLDMQLMGCFVATNQKEFLLRPTWRASLKKMIRTSIHDPFLMTSSDVFGFDDHEIEMNSFLHSVSVSQIKYVGYVQRENQFWALMMFPNGKTVAVTLGSSLGAENAYVESLNEQRAILDVAGRKMMLTCLNSSQ